MYYSYIIYSYEEIILIALVSLSVYKDFVLKKINNRCLPMLKWL